MTDSASFEKGAMEKSVVVEPTTPTSSIPAEPSDRSAERRLIRKLDLRIIPILWTLQLVSFVDRANIGNAKIAGMEKELGLIGNNRYNTAVWVFNLGYLIAGVPVMMLFKRYGPRVLSTMMFLWAICVIGCGVSKTWYQLVVCRFLEGMCEAAYVGSAAYLIGAYYTKAEYLTRYTIFFTAGIIAGAFNGFLSSLLSKMDGTAGYKAWRWIFIVEGLITIVVAVASWWLIVPFPEDCTFLSPEDKELMLARVKEDSGHDPTEPPVTFTSVLHHLKDWKVWAAVAMNMGVTENANSIANFQPTILRGIGYKASSAQVHTIPVYITGAVFSVSLAYVSRYLNHRYGFYMLGWAVLVIGLAIEIAFPPQGNIRYMGMFFLASGAYLAMPISIVWVSINSGKGYKRAVTLGAIVNFGTAGAFVSSNVFKSNETPRFHTGFSTGLGMACMGALAATITFFGCMWENKRRDRKRAELPEVIEGDASRDSHPDFRFVY